MAGSAGVSVVAAWITSQLVFNGLIAGLEIGLLAMGIVLIYRSTRVINFAVGNMGLVGASLLALLVIEYDIPFWLAAIGSLIVGTLFGTIMELVVIRRLFYAPRVVVLVSTIGISGLALAIVTAYPEITDFSATYPPAVDTTWSDVLGVRVTGAQLAVLVVVPVVALVLGWFLNRTLVGRTVKASAENPDLARVQGHQPQAGLDCGVVDRRVPGDAHHDAGGGGQRRSGEGPPHPRAEHARPCAGGSSHRRHGVVPARDGRGNRDRRHPGIDQLQLPRQARPHRRSAPGRGADRGGAAEPQSGAGRDADVLVRAEGARDPRAAARRLVGEAAERRRPRSAAALRDPPPTPDHAALAPSPLRHHRLLRDLRALADRAHRLGGPAVLGSDGLRRLRCPGRGGVDARPEPRSGRGEPRPRCDAVPALDRDRRVRVRRPRRAHRGGCAACAWAVARGQHVRVLSGCFAVPVPPARAVRRPHHGAVPARIAVRARPVVTAHLLLRVSGRARDRVRRRESAAEVGDRSHHDRGARQRRPGRGLHRRRGSVEAARVRDRRVHRRLRRRVAGRCDRSGAVHRALLPGGGFARARRARW